MSDKVCRVCGCVLVVGENITEPKLKNREYRCPKCSTEYHKRYREENRETERERYTKYYWENRERILERMKTWTPQYRAKKRHERIAAYLAYRRERTLIKQLLVITA